MEKKLPETELEKDDLLMAQKCLESRLIIKEDEQRLGNPYCYIPFLDGIICAEISCVHDLVSSAGNSNVVLSSVKEVLWIIIHCLTNSKAVEA